MNLPPLIMTAVLLFWGAQTGFIPLAVIMALSLELSRLTKRRWDFDDADFNRLADICAVVIVGMFVYFLSTTPIKAFYIVGQWLPVTFFPLIAMQIYSSRRRVRVSALIWMLRRAEARGELAPRHLDLTYPYLALCVIAAGAANMRSAWFYPGIIVLTAWILYPLRSKRYSLVTWSACLMLAAITGLGLHTGMHNFQRMAMRWYYQNFMHMGDPLFASTAIGDIGDLKPSGKIIFRAKQAGATSLPDLLTEGVYNIYNSRGWIALGAELKSMRPAGNSGTWSIAPGTGAKAAVTIALPLKWGKGVLKLPADTVAITGLPVAVLRRNRLGSLTVEDGPGLVTYTAKTGIPDRTPPPDRYDLKIPNQEMEAVKTVARSLGLKGRPPREIITVINNWFRKNFSYSLKQRDHGQGTGLPDFLLRSRSGHCEYFATATVLLLREAGIPARYVTGYGLPEGNGDSSGWLAVRNRDAHAWATAFVKGKWLTVDTTPPGWNQADEENASFWEPLYNRISDLYFAYTLWRWGEERNLSDYLLWLLIPMILYLGRNLFRRRETRKNMEKTAQKPAEIIRPGTDSAFYRVEQALLSRGYDRFEGETLKAWLSRIQPYLPDTTAGNRIPGLLSLHYKYRFDPLGLSADEKERLAREADDVLTGLESRAT